MAEEPTWKFDAATGTFKKGPSGEVLADMASDLACSPVDGAGGRVLRKTKEKRGKREEKKKDLSPGGGDITKMKKYPW